MATSDRPELQIVDPTSATEEEIDPGVDRDRIRVVRKISMLRSSKKTALLAAKRDGFFFFFFF